MVVNIFKIGKRLWNKSTKNKQKYVEEKKEVWFSVCWSFKQLGSGVEAEIMELVFFLNIIIYLLIVQKKFYFLDLDPCSLPQKRFVILNILSF